MKTTWGADVSTREALGMVTNATTLQADRVVGALDLLGALAFTDDLGRLLWRAKYGGDLRTLTRAHVMLADSIRRARRFSRWATGKQQRRSRHPGARQARELVPADVAEALAARVLAEWINDRCAQCDGRGMVGGEQYLGARVLVRCKACKAEGWLVQGDGDDARRVTCGTCNGRGRTDKVAPERGPSTVCGCCKGSGRAQVEHAVRAAALGLTLDTYRRRWVAVFDALFAKLDAVDERTAEALRAQLRPGTVRANSDRSGPDTRISPDLGGAGHPAQHAQETSLTGRPVLIPD